MRFRACYAIKNENMGYLQLGGGTPEGRILVWHYGVNANISLLLQAIEHLTAQLIPDIYVSGCYVNFFGDFWVYFGD